MAAMKKRKLFHTDTKILDIDDGDSVSKDDKLSVITGYKISHSILKEMLCRTSSKCKNYNILYYNDSQ